MELSIQNWILYRYKDSEAIELFSKSGFSNIDWNFKRYDKANIHCLESKEKCRKHHKKLRKQLDDLGMKVVHSHAPFPTFYTEKNKENILIAMENSFLASSILGAKYIVVHPMMPRSLEGKEHRAERMSLNIDFYNTIKQFAVRYGVKIALENMFGLMKGVGIYEETSCSRYEELMELFVSLNDKENFVICYDNGHGNMILKENNLQYIEAFGDNLKMIHLHDNNGLLDLHKAPYDKGTVDWKATFATLKKIGYNGVINFEINPKELGTFKRNHLKNLTALRENLENMVKELY